MNEFGTLKAFFQRTFGESPARTVRAPGRLELLGNHTDYNGGLVLAMAIDRHVYFGASPRMDGQIHLATTAFPERPKFYFDRLEKGPKPTWADYVKSVLWVLQRRGVHFTGFNGAIHSTVPLGAGLASSAALLMATALIVRELFPYRLTATGLGPAPRRERERLPPLSPAERLCFAQMGGAAESEYVGLNCGLLDYLCSMFGQEGHALEIDALTNTVRPEPLPPGLAVVVCDSKVKHELASGGYNELRENCDRAAAKLGVDFLRRIDSAQLEAARAKLTAREYECARHIVGENQRVTFALRAFRAGDLSQAGQYFLQSHESSRDSFRNSTPPLDVLVEIARNLPGCLGARLSGGGFGGVTVNLVHSDAAAAFCRSLPEEFRRRTGVSTHAWICSAAAGAA